MDAPIYRDLAQPTFQLPPQPAHQSVSKIFWSQLVDTLKISEFVLNASAENNSAVARRAAAEGRVDVLQHLRGRGMKLTNFIMYEALAHGQVEVVKYILRIHPQLEISSSDIAQAASGGFTGVLECLHAMGKFALSEEVWKAAVKGGSLHTLEWLHSHGCRSNVSCIHVAVDNVHIDVICFLIRVGRVPSLKKSRIISDACFWKAVAIPCATWIDQLLKYDPPPMGVMFRIWAKTCKDRSDSVARALTKHTWALYPRMRPCVACGLLQFGNASLFEYITSELCPNRVFGSVRMEILCAVKSGSVRTLNLIETRHFKSFHETAVVLACNAGKFDTARFLLRCTDESWRSLRRVDGGGMVLLRKALWANARQVCKLHCLHGHPVAAACDRERARL